MIAPDPERLPSPDDIVAGKYRVVRVIAEGGMGVVLEAYQDRLERAVALKILHPHVRADKEIAARFEREARAAARLTGPNVVRVIDVDNLEDGSPVMVMELLTGRDLATDLQRRGAMQVEEAVGYVLQACAAMAEAHRLGIVHRDLKPANLYLQTAGAGRQVVKVLDFGISKLMSIQDVAMTSTQSMLGTPLYMSPEQVRSAKNVDGRTDIWSLGIILYELLAGVPPFHGQSATAVAAAIVADEPPRLSRARPGLPKGLVAAIMRSLEKNPDDRFPDVAAFAAAISPFGPPEAVMPGDVRASVADLGRVTPQDRSAGAFDDTALAKSAPGFASTIRRTRWPWAIAILAVVAVGSTTALLARSRGASPQEPLSAAPMRPTVASSAAVTTPLAADSVVQVPSATASAAQPAPAASSVTVAPAATPRRRQPVRGSVESATTTAPPPATPPPPPPATTAPLVNPLHL